MINTGHIPLTLLAVVATFVAVIPESAAQTSPNIVFIMADDWGWTDLSGDATNLGNGSDFYQTPNLDALAAQGMAFTSAYTCGANCAPTRAALLSGQYAPRPTNNVYAVGNLNRPGGVTVPLIGPSQGLASNGQDQIPGAAITIAETLQTAGYVTAHIGKYHVGDPANTTDNNGPQQQGFNANFGGNATGNPGSTFFASESGVFVSSNIGPELDPFAAQYAQPYVDGSLTPFASGNDPNTLPGTNKHLTDAETDAAVQFMSNNASSPFFIHLAYHAVHTPISGQGRPDLVDKYVALPDGIDHNNDDYAALAEGIDQSVGRIVNYLKTTADPRNPGQMLSENTLVVVYSDNGGLEGATENSPLKGQKGDYAEGGIRVPMIVWGAGVDGGTINHTPVTSVDFYPTFADVAGATLPQDYALDGESLAPVFQDANAGLARDAIYWHFPGYLLDSGRNQRPQSILRKDINGAQWKLLHNYEDGSWELYDLANDIGEANNLAATEMELVEQLGDQLTKWLMDLKAPLPKIAATGEAVPYPGLISGDLNFDDKVNVVDWQALRTNLFSDLTSLSGSEAYQLGDLNLDGLNNEEDFVLFKSYYDAQNGTGSFDQMVATVPEPSAAVQAVLLFGGFSFGVQRAKQHTSRHE